MPRKRATYDSPWKQIIGVYFKDFLAFFFPTVHDGVDWSKKPEFLDKELLRLNPQASTGVRTVDKLVKVWWIDGTETWVLVHVELQSQVDAGFAERMFVYAYRLYDQYQLPVVSLAVLGDTNLKWRPQDFDVGKAGALLSLRFPMVKLVDYWDRWAELEASDNPFALAVMAHLQAQATRRDPATRFDAKLALVRRLYQRGYSASSATRLLRFIDWVLQLSDELTPLFWREVDTMEQIKPVPYRMKFERDYFAAKKAMRKSKREMRKALLVGIEAYLELKFGDDGLELLPAISSITDTNKLQAILTALRPDITLAEVQQLAAAPD